LAIKKFFKFCINDEGENPLAFIIIIEKIKYSKDLLNKLNEYMCTPGISHNKKINNQQESRITKKLFFTDGIKKFLLNINNRLIETT